MPASYGVDGVEASLPPSRVQFPAPLGRSVTMLTTTRVVCGVRSVPIMFSLRAPTRRGWLSSRPSWKGIVTPGFDVSTPVRHEWASIRWVGHYGARSGTGTTHSDRREGQGNIYPPIPFFLGPMNPPDNGIGDPSWTPTTLRWVRTEFRPPPCILP